MHISIEMCLEGHSANDNGDVTPRLKDLGDFFLLYVFRMLEKEFMLHFFDKVILGCFRFTTHSRVARAVLNSRRCHSHGLQCEGWPLELRDVAALPSPILVQL